MDPRHRFIDSRHFGKCIYCGKPPDTREHVPSRVLLDDPLPTSPLVVEACAVCNQGFSLHEEYLACFLDCVISGSVNPASVQREKVRKILERKPKLAKRIASSQDLFGNLTWQPESDRIQKVISKLAQGHVAYELYPTYYEPDSITIIPFAHIPKHTRAVFENPLSDSLHVLPEFGSRAFSRACGVPPDPHQIGDWIVVQPGRYRYVVRESGGILVRIVLSEYLACEIIWN